MTGHFRGITVPFRGFSRDFRDVLRGISGASQGVSVIFKGFKYAAGRFGSVPGSFRGISENFKRLRRRSKGIRVPWGFKSVTGEFLLKDFKAFGRNSVSRLFQGVSEVFQEILVAFWGYQAPLGEGFKGVPEGNKGYSW